VVISESGLLRFVFQLIVRHSNTGSAMSSMGHYRSIDAIDGESALAPGAVISLRRTNRRFGPQASFMHRNKKLMLRWSIAGGKLQSLCRYSLRVDSNSRFLPGERSNLNRFPHSDTGGRLVRLRRRAARRLLCEIWMTTYHVVS
jgi:hypothetical protein